MSSMLCNAVSVATLGVAIAGAASPLRAEDPVKFGSVRLQLVEQVEVPARAAGVLTSVDAVEGDDVKLDQRVATIDDREARLAVDRAELEAAIARREAESDDDVRGAQRTVEVTTAEYERALRSVQQFAKAYSKNEMDRLRLAADQAALALEKATRQRAIAQTTLKLKQNETAAASEAVARRQITAPLAGVVAQVYKRQGEWVKPGDNVMRVLRVDRLRAEFFVPADSARADWRGRAVQFVVQHGDGPPRTFSGRVVFVSTEINKINNEVQVWAEIENRARSLRPGVEGTLTMP